MVVCLTITCFICISCCCLKAKKSSQIQVYFIQTNQPCTKMGMLKACSKTILWILWRIAFLLFRAVIWFVLLRYFKIWSNRRQSAYKRTVHVQKILFRHKIDEVVQPASSRNFLTMHQSFQDPEYLLSKNISLYCLSKTEAFFVECDPNIDVAHSDVSSFYRIAQFQKAINLIVVPIHVFHKIADKIGEYRGNLIFLTNTARCGSTLLTQIFEETGQTIALSEPDALNTLSMLSAELDEEDFERYTRSTINILCKNMHANTRNYVIKLAQPNLILTPFLAKYFPNARQLFMYRNGIYVAKSLAKIINGTPLTGFLFKFAKNCCCLKVGRKIATGIGLPVKDYDSFDTIQSPLQVGTIMWASSMKQYLEFCKSGIKIAAVRYEDIISDTDYAMEKIFTYCYMPFDKVAVERALSKDSQRGSPVSRDILGQFDHQEITEDMRTQSDMSCEIFEVPSIFKTFIARNTISYRPLSHGMRDEDTFSLVLDNDGSASPGPETRTGSSYPDMDLGLGNFHTTVEFVNEIPSIFEVTV